MTELRVRCCIAGGGPAGMMLGLLLARAGIEVLVLEKHGDFLRDFRGDMIHPSTLEVIYELGLLDGLLRLPHQRVAQLEAQIGGETIPIADFRHLPTRCGFIAIMPQWDFLDFLVKSGSRYPGFAHRMNAEVTGLIEEDGRIVGLRATTADGDLYVRSDLVIGADGRHSTVRRCAGLHVEELGAPMDVLWFRLSRGADDPETTMGRFDRGRIFILINRGAHWQCGFVIRKGSADEIRSRGLQAFRESVAQLVPFAVDRMAEISDWDAVKLLTVAVDRLKRWHRPGLLCIGDAAHAMSPVGGVGINLAIQDAVAAANILALPLSQGAPSEEHLALVQHRRAFSTRVTQWLQIAAQNRIISRSLDAGRQIDVPLPLRLLQRLPALRRIPGRMIGMGIRPEHVRLHPYAG